MTDNNRLENLAHSLADAQRELIDAAADAGGVPPERVLRKIADLELAIGAIDRLLHEGGNEPA